MRERTGERIDRWRSIILYIFICFNCVDLNAKNDWNANIEEKNNIIRELPLEIIPMQSVAFGLSSSFERFIFLSFRIRCLNVTRSLTHINLVSCGPRFEFITHFCWCRCVRLWLAFS